jgi:hypothetical protein
MAELWGPNSGNDTNTGGPKCMSFRIVYPICLFLAVVLTFSFLSLLSQNAYLNGYK